MTEAREATEYPGVHERQPDDMAPPGPKAPEVWLCTFRDINPGETVSLLVCDTEPIYQTFQLHVAGLIQARHGLQVTPRQTSTDSTWWGGKLELPGWSSSERVALGSFKQGHVPLWTCHLKPVSHSMKNQANLSLRFGRPQLERVTDRQISVGMDGGRQNRHSHSFP